MSEDKDELDTMIEIFTALGQRTPYDQLAILEMCWLCVANNTRTEALIRPDGFPAERARQVERLQKLAAIVAAHEPDLEMERLFHEGDVEGMLRRVQQIRTDGAKGGE
jgi:hypothetical protein